MQNSPRSLRLWRWLLLFYLLGIVLDTGWHVHFYLATGDREIESHEWVIGIQASLFWPLDLLAQLALALHEPWSAGNIHWIAAFVVGIEPRAAPTRPSQSERKRAEISDEGRAVLRRSRNPAARLFGKDPEAPGAARLSPDPVARHEVLRAFRPRRLHPVPRLQGRCDQGITFVDTGISANIGERLKAVEPFLEGEEIFLANYSDGLTDFPLPTLIDDFKRRGSIGTFLAVRPNYSFHFVSRATDGTVLGVDNVVSANAWINGGYFVFRRAIFDYIKPGEELVEQPFQRLIEERLLAAHDYEGFWRCVDTFKDLQALEGLYAQGRAPWEVWHGATRRDAPPPGRSALPAAPHRRRPRRNLAAAGYQPV